jgi:tripartite-type tricarboxylate transporter receptor subunit TctC
MAPVFRRTAIAALASIILSPPRGWTQSLPALRLVYPFAAGNVGDGVARMLADRLKERLGRAVVVDNRSGAGGRIGVKSAIDAAADGSTLLFVPGSMIVLQPHTERELGYDPLIDLQPLAHVMRTDLALSVTPAWNVRSLAELTARLRSDPVQAAYGSPGAGTSAHFIVAEYARLAALELRHVPYRGSAAALPDLMAGHLPMFGTALPEVLEHHKAGRLRVAATSGETRSPALPEVPTFKESGIDIVAPFWYGLYASSKVPTETASGLSLAIMDTMRLADVRQRIAATGFEATGDGPDELRQIQSIDTRFWHGVVKASGLLPS